MLIKPEHACASLIPMLISGAFLCRYRTLEPELAEETYLELSDTETEDPTGIPSVVYPGKGETYIIPYSFQLACLAVI